jgi:hypothetical protein
MRRTHPAQRSGAGPAGNLLRVELLQEKAAKLKRLLERLERALAARPPTEDP